MKCYVIAPFWISYAITALTMMALSPFVLLPIDWGWRCFALIYALLAWLYTYQCLLTKSIQIIPCGQTWRLHFPDGTIGGVSLTPDALLFCDWLWCGFCHERGTYHALITPSMMTEKAYCQLRRTINLRKILGKNQEKPVAKRP